VAVSSLQRRLGNLVQTPASTHKTARWPRPSTWYGWLAAVIAVFAAAPIALLAAGLLHPDLDLWAHLWDTILPRMLLNTLLLMVGVGVGTAVIGVSLAWLVTAFRFPGARFFEKALLLPLAVPSFVMGFVFMATFDYAGPVQTAWRSAFGREIAFPNLHNGWGAVIVLTLVLYPYVYLLARAAFREQAATTFEAARVMGYGAWRSFFQLVLPLARPSIVAGVSLAVMEAMTDFAVVRFFGFPTLSEGVVRIWEGRMDREGAAQLAALLLFFILGLLLLEHLLRGKARYHQRSGGRTLAKMPLRGWKAWSAAALCALVLGLAFVMPVGQLLGWALSEFQSATYGDWRSVFGSYVGNSFGLAASAALLTLVLAVVMAHSARFSGKNWLRGMARLGTLGYAMPGSVVAAGVLLTLAPVDRAASGLSVQFGGAGGLLLMGSVVGLMYAYIVRFMAVGYSSVNSSLEKVTPNMEQAARTMGAQPLRVLLKVQAPLISTGIAAGLILVFVDVMKELPATLLLRPFGMDTLSIWSYMLAAESFWQAAAIPALTIVLVGLLPVIMLMRLDGRAQRR
jgi:iron(III) transport system permease protein